ncbi:hypothetical protein RJ639_013870 [Escallonia herrerae]|uniref:Reverse transcriptase domain-containing protein n=1 Tax=Escallonia herrerae TaxID=1293975 RepID=A0AA88VIP2_9ASTE|nr:hypothetical protein RJ639_013870 [Escallonia herrerae]
MDAYCCLRIPYKQAKPTFREDLSKVIDSFPGPWLGIGDFNEITNTKDKKGGRAFASSSNGLAAVIHEKGLVGLGFIGNPFTWSNKRNLQANIRERIDRGLANMAWCLLFPNATVKHLPAHQSDHNPILLNTREINPPNPKSFKFMACWTRDNSSHYIVEHAWKIKAFGAPPFKLCQKIRNTRLALRTWNQNHFDNIQTKIKILSEALDQTQKEDPSASNLEREKNLQCNLDEELKREESLWQDRSRYKRILEGDLNTKFFHLTTIIKRHRNAIDFIKDGEGTWITGTNQVERCFNNHFEQTFSTCKPTFPPDFENLLTHSIFEADNLLMCAIPTDSEIEKALNHMGSHKAPGPDEMTSLFFKTYRKITSFDVKESVKNFFITGHILKEQNHTLIALIPKQDNPVSILASRLQAVLHQLVSPLQAAFVPKRLINDNSIIVQELWHTMRKKKGKNGLMAIKIDMEKAYDKMEWSFILNVLKNFGFDQKWIGWVEQCISTATFSTLINGAPHGLFPSSRDLRQGDPISPFLFILGYPFMKGHD